jgi:acyl-CoA reductase-like NAD-dependent aldehyde dehydrogenase
MTTVSANAQADAEFEAAEAQRKAEEQEALRGIAQEQQEGLEQQSDIMRSAQKELGAVQASETMLTESSLGSLLYAGAYDLNVGLGRIEEQTARDEAFRRSQQADAISRQRTRGVQAAGRASQQISKAVGSTLQTAVGAGMSVYNAPKTPGKGDSSFFADSF